MLSGRTLQVLLGFRNSGETPQTVSQITGSLNSPKHFSLYVSNFSTATYNLVVEPGKETSFEYLLKVDPQLAGHDFTLALTVFYQDASDRYSSTFINATIPVFDPDASFDTQTIFMYMSLISLAFAATYVVLQATGTLGGVKIFAKKIFWVTSGRGSRVQQPRVPPRLQLRTCLPEGVQEPVLDVDKEEVRRSAAQGGATCPPDRGCSLNRVLSDTIVLTEHRCFRASQRITCSRSPVHTGNTWVWNT